MRVALIFVSYRRDDSSGHAGRLRDRLVAALGEDQVFFDVDAESGVRVADEIAAAIASCSAFVAVMGRAWLDARDRDGVRRLDASGDLVRRELEAALARDDLRCFPVLVNGAGMPRADELPVSIRPLTQWNAHTISD